MRKIFEILRLVWHLGLSHRDAARSARVARSTVSEYLRRATAAGLSWPLPEELDEPGLQALLFASKPSVRADELPDWSKVEAELKRRGVTRQVLWEEYRERCPNGLSYSRFCAHYRQWLANGEPTMILDHVAGDALMVDFAGMTMPITDRRTGDVRQTQVFVATLPASSWTFARALESQQSEDWLMAHVQAFEAMGGVPRSVVPDNLKSGVTKADFYDPDINPAYADLAQHYGVAVLPTRVRKPRDKASVESHVRLVENQILGRLRNRTFFSLAELNQAIAELLVGLNAKPMQQKSGSRTERFALIDKPALKPLPVQPYRFGEWQRQTLPRGYHVRVNGHRYSVPHTLIGELLDVRSNRQTVEIFHRGKRVACHVTRDDTEGHTTEKSHMPAAHRQAGQRPDELIEKAQQLGDHVALWVEQTLKRHRHPEQGCRSAMGTLKLAKLYDPERLDAACARALTLNSWGSKSVRSMLEKGLERLDTTEAHSLPGHAHVRGSDYYH